MLYFEITREFVLYAEFLNVLHSFCICKSFAVVLVSHKE